MSNINDAITIVPTDKFSYKIIPFVFAALGNMGNTNKQAEYR